jgi:hypothetical protein
MALNRKLGRLRVNKFRRHVPRKSIIEISFHGSCLAGKRATRWKTLEEASAAAAIYEAAKKYPIEGFKCDKCGWFHIRCDEKRFAEAFERAKQRAREIQAHVGDTESDDLESEHVSARPNYSERRQAQIASQQSRVVS